MLMWNRKLAAVEEDDCFDFDDDDVDDDSHHHLHFPRLGQTLGRFERDFVVARDRPM